MQSTLEAANKCPVQLCTLGQLGDREMVRKTVVTNRGAQYTQGMGTARVPLGHSWFVPGMVSDGLKQQG